MVREHTRAGALVAQLAQQLNTELPTEPDALHLVALDALSTRRGRAIDEAYIYQMILDHEQAIRLFRNEIAVGTDPKVKAFARANVPVLRRHLRDAILLARSLRLDIVRR
jgi:putative membrane protein